MSSSSKTNSVERSLGRIEGKVEEGFKSIDARLSEFSIDIKSNCEEIKKLKSRQDTMLGEVKGANGEQKRMAGIVGAVAGGFVTAISWFFYKFFN
jgi:hypothetical protein